MREQQRTYTKRWGSILLILLLACTLFIIAMHWTHALHNNSGGQREAPTPSHVVDIREKITDSSVVETVYKEAPVYLPVLMYHHLDEEPERFESVTLTPERFEEDMLILSALGFETIDTNDLVQYIEGNQTLPEKPIMVTIDDGYRSVYEHAYPVLKQLDQKAVATVIGSSVGRRTHLFAGFPIVPHFDWDEAEEMKEDGVVDVQSHSFDLHNPGIRGQEARGAERLPSESRQAYIERFKADTINNQEFIEENMSNHRVVLYAYPYGLYNELAESVLSELGYVATLTIEPGINKLEDGFSLMRRMNMASYDSGVEAFRDILSMMGEQTPIPYADSPTRAARIASLKQSLGLSLLDVQK